MEANRMSLDQPVEYRGFAIIGKRDHLVLHDASKAPMIACSLVSISTHIVLCGWHQTQPLSSMAPSVPFHGTNASPYHTYEPSMHDQPSQSQSSPSSSSSSLALALLSSFPFPQTTLPLPSSPIFLRTKTPLASNLPSKSPVSNLPPS